MLTLIDYPKETFCAVWEGMEGGQTGPAGEPMSPELYPEQHAHATLRTLNTFQHDENTFNHGL